MSDQQIEIFDNEGEPLLVAEDIADEAGLQPRSFHAYVQRGMAPEPTGYVSRTPVWRESVISEWMETRNPRPRKSTLAASKR